MAARKVVDCHIHISDVKAIDNLIKIKDGCRLKALNILAAPAFFDYTQNVLGLVAKLLYPKNTYVFGGLNHALPGEEGVESFEQQAQGLIEMGVDGIKMIEGKPTIIKELGYSFNHEKYQGFYSYLSSKGIPLLMHVADPATFWDRGKIPDWALQNGWYYGGNDYLPLLELYEQIEKILNKYPGLNLILAHFYFMSDDLSAATDFLNKYPNVKFDITPGTEMYHNFSMESEKWREFFINHQDRILFGTDNTGKMSAKEAIAKVDYMKKFLESDQEFDAWGGIIQGINLDEKVLDKIYHKNFFRFVGEKPNPINTNLLTERCSYLERLAEEANEEDMLNEIKAIKNILERKGYFA